MKMWILFEQVWDESYHYALGKRAVAGVCFDEEEALEIARRTTVAYWREHADEFAKVHEYELESWMTIEMMSDDDVWAVSVKIETQRLLVDEVDTRTLFDGAAGRSAALRALAAVL